MTNEADLPTFAFLPEHDPPEILNKIALLNESQIKYAEKVLKIFLVINAPEEVGKLAGLG